MEYIHDTMDFKLKNTAVTIGKFDGLHNGHKLLLANLSEIKKEKGFKTVIITFDFQPKQVLKGQVIKPIYTWEEEFKVLEAEGPDVVIRCPFTEELANLSPEAFVKNILVDKLDIKAIVVGDDFRFGKDRAGDGSLLKELGIKYGFETRVINRLTSEGEAISSTLIRDLIDKGNIARAEALLGRKLS